MASDHSFGLGLALEMMDWNRFYFKKRSCRVKRLDCFTMILEEKGSTLVFSAQRMVLFLFRNSFLLI